MSVRVLVAVMGGFAASVLGYDLTHQEKFPELARDAFGVLALTAVIALFDRQEAERLLLSAFGFGTGVTVARLLMQMWRR